MKSAVAMGVLAGMSLALASGPSMVMAADKHDEPSRGERRTEDQDNMHLALRDLKRARTNLFAAERAYPEQQRSAMEQTNYAIEQVYAALRDDTAKANDAKDVDRERANADRMLREKNKTPREAMNDAMKNLENARRDLDEASRGDYGEHRTKAMDFTDQALRNVRDAVGERR